MGEWTNDRVVSIFEERCREKLRPLLGDNSLREQQITVLRGLLEKRHVFAQLPTGYGKSLPFFAYPLLSGAAVIVISPLRALMDSHASDAERLGFTVVQLEKLEESGSPTIHPGENAIIMGSPETLLIPGVKTALTNILPSLPSVLIVLDEAHCVPKWGYGEITGKNKAVAFRAAFSKLYVLRTMVSVAHQFLFLTATATAASRNAILRAVGFRPKDVFFIVQHPVRNNITFAVQQLTASSDDEEDSQEWSHFKWLIDHARANIQVSGCDRILVYCITIADCAKLYKYIAEQLLSVDRSMDIAASVEMYHSAIVERKKTDIVTDLCSVDGQLSIVIATNALGMGVDVKRVKKVVIYGIPTDFEDIVQMAGRGGRSESEQCECIVYYSNRQWSGKSKQHQLRDWIQNSSSCRRRRLIEQFTDDYDASEDEQESRNIGPPCCDVCISAV